MVGQRMDDVGAGDDGGSEGRIDGILGEELVRLPRCLRQTSFACFRLIVLLLHGRQQRRNRFFPQMNL